MGKSQERYEKAQNDKGLVKVATWVPADMRSEFLKIADKMRRERGIVTSPSPRGKRAKKVAPS